MGVAGGWGGTGQGMGAGVFRLGHSEAPHWVPDRPDSARAHRREEGAAPGRAAQSAPAGTEVRISGQCSVPALTQVPEPLPGEEAAGGFWTRLLGGPGLVQPSLGLSGGGRAQQLHLGSRLRREGDQDETNQTSVSPSHSRFEPLGGHVRA